MNPNEEEFADVVEVLKARYAADRLPGSLRDGVLRKLDQVAVRKRRAWAAPLTAAALFLGGLIALVALPGDPVLTPASQDTDPQRLEMLQREIARVKEEIRKLEEEIDRAARRAPPVAPAGGAPGSPTFRITAVAGEIGLVVFSGGKEDGVVEGAKYYVHRNSTFVAQIVIERVDRKWSAGKVLLKTQEPKVADYVELPR